MTRLPASPQELPTGTSYKTTMLVGLEGMAILNGVGQPVPQAEARKRLARETSVLVTANGEKPSSVYLRGVAPETLVFVFPREAPAFEPARWPVDQPADPLGNRRL